MLDSMQLEDFTQISSIFHADLTQNGLQNCGGMFRNRSGILAESLYILSMLDSMQLKDFTQI